MLSLSSSCLTNDIGPIDPDLEPSILPDASYADAAHALHKPGFPYFVAPTLPRSPLDRPSPDLTDDPAPAQPARRKSRRPPARPSPKQASVNVLVHRDPQHRTAHVRSTLAAGPVVKQSHAGPPGTPSTGSSSTAGTRSPTRTPGTSRNPSIAGTSGKEAKRPQQYLTVSDAFRDGPPEAQEAHEMAIAGSVCTRRGSYVSSPGASLPLLDSLLR